MSRSVLYGRSAEAHHADIGNELVLLAGRTNECFGFNEVAAMVWRQLEQPKTFSALRAALLTEYDVSSDQCSVELQALLDELLQLDLVATETGREGR